MKTLGPRIGTLSTNRLKEVNSESWRSGKTTAERGYGSKWQRARASFLFDNPLCKRCKDKGKVTEAKVVDHEIPHRGDQRLFWDRNNWTSLCTPCHSGDKQREEARDYK